VLFRTDYTIYTLPILDRDELGSVPLNRTCGHSTSAWCQLGNGLRIVNGGSGQWKRLISRMGHALDDDDDDDEYSIGLELGLCLMYK